MKYDITVSIVVYFDNNYGDINTLKKCIKSLLSSKLNIKIIILDNSSKKLEINELNDKRIEYIFIGKNLGFGRAHNIAIKKSKNISKYHLILNPDVYFNIGVLETLKNYMENNPNVVALTPKILYDNGNIQYICKLLPTPTDLIFRRFIPFKKYLEKRNRLYEMRFKNYESIFDAPVISGSFIFTRTYLLNKLGGFDKRFFLYMEDVDLCRRLLNFGKIRYIPYVFVYHKFKRASYKKIKYTIIHIISALKYFNKWGWFDKNRNRINRNFI